jgi:putative endonuclease
VHLPRPVSSDPRQSLGQLGEDLACAELQRRGYAILARRFRTRLGEIDIVADDGGTLVFVEVKTRAGPAFGDGAAAVTAWKQRRVSLVAMEFLARQRAWNNRPCRFDVVSVDVAAGPGRRGSVEVFPGAFDARV